MMLQLVNLSNYSTDLVLIRNDAAELQAFLQRNGLDGLEMMFCDSWDPSIHRLEWIHGVHLQFWPSWLDFWRGDYQELLRQFGSRANIIASYGGLKREDWLNRQRANIRQAREAQAKYLVWHVCHNRLEEIFDWRFSASDREVVDGAIEVINEVADEIPADMTLLLENLWWPGMTLRDPGIIARLLEKIRHPRLGIMLDTGHLMNTNQDLRSQAEGIEYVLHTIDSLGEYSRSIHGIHLHYSLSGPYIRQTRGWNRQSCSLEESISHVLKIDQHLPFTDSQVCRILDRVRPEWLVHEFVQKSAGDWEEKVVRQQRALGLRHLKGDETHE
ncbi:sugar phosphate isomerase/epimerase family protein [Acetonema longum]|nr:TIM barrel protein [Acetonema longum]